MGTVLERKIKTYVPTDGEGNAVAIIHGLGVHFFGETPMVAHKKAHAWRVTEFNKLQPPHKRVAEPQE